MNFSALSCSFQSIFFNFLIKTTSQGKGRNVLHAKVSIKIMANKLFCTHANCFYLAHMPNPSISQLNGTQKNGVPARGDFLRKHAGKKENKLPPIKMFFIRKRRNLCLSTILECEIQLQFSD